jgi:hypothetical protein
MNVILDFLINLNDSNNNFENNLNTNDSIRSVNQNTCNYDFSEFVDSQSIVNDHININILNSSDSGFLPVCEPSNVVSVFSSQFQNVN